MEEGKTSQLGENNEFGRLVFLLLLTNNLVGRQFFFKPFTEYESWVIKDTYVIKSYGIVYSTTENGCAQQETS